MNKAWWQSKGMWGALIAALAGVAGVFGVVITGEDQAYLVETAEQIAMLGASLASLIGGVLAWYGRKRAEGPIRKDGDTLDSHGWLAAALLGLILAAGPLAGCGGGFGIYHDSAEVQSVRADVRAIIAAQDTVDIAELATLRGLNNGVISIEQATLVYDAASAVRPAIKAAWAIALGERQGGSVAATLQTVDASFAVLQAAIK